MKCKLLHSKMRIKVNQNIELSQNREINMSRKFHVIRYVLFLVLTSLAPAPATTWTPSNVSMSCSLQCKFFNYELVIKNVFYFSVFISLRYF